MSASIAEAPRAPAWPIFGAVPNLMRFGTIEFMERAWKELGDTFRVQMGPREWLAIVHPDAVAEVLVTARENFVKGATYDQLRVLTGDGLLTLEGDAWRTRRRIAQPAFHKESLRALIAAMARVVDDGLNDLARRLPRGGLVDAHEETMALTLDVVGETLLGERLGAGRDESARAFGAAMERLGNRGNSPVTIPLDWPLPSNVRLKRALRTLDEMVYAIIRRSREAPRPTLLSMLMQSRDAESGAALDERELRDEVITLVLAGHETTALLLTWGFTLLGRAPDVVARLRDEARAVLGGRLPTADDLPKLSYTRQVIDEILRLRPPAWALGRDTLADSAIRGYRVRRGMTVMPVVYLTHRHPDFWDAPNAFDPDRFSADRSRGRHNFAYLPFSTGPRTCIGNLFAIAEAQVILAMLADRANFDLLSYAPVPMRPAFTLRPGAPIYLRLTWR